jgi:hypothetical protein
MKRLWLLLGLLVLLPSLATGQGVVSQSGSVVVGHAPAWSVNRVLRDAGSAGGNGPGLGELLQINPASPPGTGPLGAHSCFLDAPATSPHHFLCLDAGAAGGGLIDFGATGGASLTPLQIIVNGVPNIVPGSITGIPIIATNAALLLTPTTQYASVMRAGFTARGDSPPIVYTASGSPCSLNAGAGDGGSQVASADGKCWLAPLAVPMDIRQFGVVVDGATNNTATLANATAWANSTGGTLIQPVGTMLVGATVAFTGSNWAWLCSSGGVSHRDTGGSLASGCVLQIANSFPVGSSNYMVTVQSPLGTTANGRVQGVHIVGLSFNGTAPNGTTIVKGALDIRSIINSEFEYLYGAGFNGGTGGSSGAAVFMFDNVAATPTNFGDPCDNQLLNVHDITTDQRANTSVGMAIQGYYNQSLPNHGCATSYATFSRINLQYNTTDGFDDWGGDNNVFDTLIGFQLLANTSYLYHAGTITDGTHFNSANSEILRHLSWGTGTGSLTTVIKIDGTDTLACAVSTTCPFGIKLEDFDASNDTGFAPTLGTGIRPMIDVTWDFNNNTSQPWVAYTPTITCESGSPGTVTAKSGIFFKRGAVVTFEIGFTLGTLTTCTSGLLVSLPVGAAVTGGAGYITGADASNGVTIGGWVDGTQGTQGLARLRFSGAYFSGDAMVMGGSYAALNN